MVWRTTDNPNVKVADFLGWQISATYMYSTRKNGKEIKHVEYLARRGREVIKTCSWQYFKKKLSVTQLNLFEQ